MAQATLTETDRSTLSAWRRRRKTAPALALRAGIILDCADGIDNRTIAVRHNVTQQTVSKWRQRVSQLGIDGLMDARRSGGPRPIDDEAFGRLITTTLDDKPPGATPWSTRSTANEMGLSQTAVSRTWRALGLRPHRRIRSNCRRTRCL